MDFQINNISLPSQSLNQRSQKIVYLNNSDYITATCCPVCGSKDTRTLSLIQTKTQKGLQTDFCTNCDHIFFSRYPTQDWYLEYYNTRQDSSHNEQLSLTTRLKRFIRTKPIIYNFWLKKLRARHTKGAAIEAILREAITKANLLYLTRPKINKVLDIGCGYGGNLQFFQSIGLSPIGIDASPARVASCTANGLTAIQVPLSDISAVRSEGPFDLITSSHVLEHIVDLHDHLQQIIELSHDNTYLYFEVPNTTQEHIFNRSLDPVHLHVFSLHSITHLLEKYGFTIIRVLQDFDTHIFATRSKSVTVKMEYEGRMGLENYQRGMQALKEKTGECVKIIHAGGYAMTITDTKTNTEIYKDNIGFPVKSISNDKQVAIEGSITESEIAQKNALIFNYGGSQAPIIVV